jgi:hypothetical protein
LLAIKFFFLLQSCLMSDDKCEWFRIRKILFSSLFARPLSAASISDDEQMIPLRKYNNRANTAPINTHETHRSPIFTTVHSQRCFHEKGFIIALIIYISSFLSLLYYQLSQ